VPKLAPIRPEGPGAGRSSQALVEYARGGLRSFEQPMFPQAGLLADNGPQPWRPDMEDINRASTTGTARGR
jgi:hypothetical protein